MLEKPRWSATCKWVCIRVGVSTTQEGPTMGLGCVTHCVYTSSGCGRGTALCIFNTLNTMCFKVVMAMKPQKTSRLSGHQYSVTADIRVGFLNRKCAPNGGVGPQGRTLGLVHSLLVVMRKRRITYDKL